MSCTAAGGHGTLRSLNPRKYSQNSIFPLMTNILPAAGQPTGNNFLQIRHNPFGAARIKALRLFPKETRIRSRVCSTRNSACRKTGDRKRKTAFDPLICIFNAIFVFFQEGRFHHKPIVVLFYFLFLINCL
jgi:hypothetical protein